MPATMSVPRATTVRLSAGAMQAAVPYVTPTLRSPTPTSLNYAIDFARELRAPLTSMMRTTYALQVGGHETFSAEQAKQLEQLQSATRAISRLVDDLVRVSAFPDAPDAGPIADFCVDDVLRCVTGLGSPMAEKVGLRLITRNFVRGFYRGPCGTITRALVNLVVHCVKTTDRGAVVVGAKLRSPDTIEFFVRDTAAVGDTPPGTAAQRLAPPEERPPMVLPSELSLPLVIARKLLEMIDAPLEVDARLGEGEVFRFAVRLTPVGN